MIQATATLAELARTIPAASRVFHQHRLDFCCSGNRSLAEVCAASQLQVDRLIEEIETASLRDEARVRWDEQPLGDLVEHILDTYHAPLRPEIQRLLEMARKVEAVHADKPACPRGLAAHLAVMSAAVDDHLEKEEKILFPMILGSNVAYARMPIQVLSAEHDDHGAALRETRRLTSDLQIPAEACTTWRALYLGLEQLEHDLMDHIHLENNILFPRALGA